jgi:hypothetical protein
MSVESDPASVEFERRARALLERSADTLSAQTRSRLSRARYAALEQGDGARGAHGAVRWHRWLPAGALSAAVLALLMFAGQHRVAELPQAAAAGGDDLELLADRDALALAQDQEQIADTQSAPDQEADYDFYNWAVSTAQDEGNVRVGS